MVSGLAPGRLAEMLMVGMSIFGSGATGSIVSEPMPDSARPTASRAVAMGRRTKAEIMTSSPVRAPGEPGLQKPRDGAHARHAGHRRVC